MKTFSTQSVFILQNAFDFLSTSLNMIHFKANEQIFPSLLFKCLLTRALNARYADFAGCGTCLAKMISACENEYRHSRPGLRPNFVFSVCAEKIGSIF